MSVTGEAIRPIFRKADSEHFSRISDNHESEIQEKDEIIYEKLAETSSIISASELLNPDSTCVKRDIFEAEKRNFVLDSDIAEPTHVLPFNGNKPPYVERIVNHLGLILLLPLIASLTENLSIGANTCHQILSQERFLFLNLTFYISLYYIRLFRLSVNCKNNKF